MSDVPSILKTATVKATPELAFSRFTRGMGTWWPLASHSVYDVNAETVVVEERVGGRIVERSKAGAECVWGTVTAWEPPHRVAFTWHPGEEPDQATLVELRFVRVGSRTLVELRHSGFERLGAKGAKMRKGYPIGWTYVLGLYAGRRGPMFLAFKGLTAVMMAALRFKARRGEARAA